MGRNCPSITWKLPAKTIKAWGSTINLAEGCNRCRAQLLRDIHNLQKHKYSYQPPKFDQQYIEQVRIGSHHEYTKWNHETNEYDHASKPTKGYCHHVVSDYKTKYYDCLPGKDWLKAHSKDVTPDPTIEIAIDGKSLSVNGNYKSGMIGKFMSQYTRKVRAGYKTLTVTKDGHVEYCGGGVYIAVNE